MNIPEAYESCLKAMLKQKRLHHSYCVMERAEKLAAIHGGNREKAALAGLLHDICHDMAKEDQLKYLDRHGILLDGLTRLHPPLWHASCGAAYLRAELGIRDEEVLSAVRYHTTGRAGMTNLEKIVFLADATSADRDYPGAGERKLLAERSLDAAMLECLRFELGRLAESSQPMVKDAWEAYNYFACKRKGRCDDDVI